MSKQVLVTGGAGFIGSYIVDSLVTAGHSVRILDNFEEQVHRGVKPDYLNSDAELIEGSVLDSETVKKAMENVDVVFHEAAMVGVGQSMYQVSRYADTNVLGTSRILDYLANENHGVKKMIVAASMSSYGEGQYECGSCGIIFPEVRSEEQMASKQWELACPKCDKVLKPMPCKEAKPLDSTSIYAQTKKYQEEMALLIGKTYGVPVVSLRYFNVYGPRQSLNNPYTGVCAIFQSRIKNGKPPLIYEDGKQLRDFVFVRDIANANVLAMNSAAANFEKFNVGTGKPITILEVAETLSRLYGKEIAPLITNKYRKGDVRHCYPDISLIKSKLGFEPQISFESGMRELVGWGTGQEAEDLVDSANEELRAKGLVE